MSSSSMFNNDILLESVSSLPLDGQTTLDVSLPKVDGAPKSPNIITVYPGSVTYLFDSEEAMADGYWVSFYRKCSGNVLAKCNHLPKRAVICV